jgi:hypothetical protein
MGKYKFYFAFENSETDDYITEKLFQCFEVGVVPGIKYFYISNNNH